MKCLNRFLRGLVALAGLAWALSGYAHGLVAFYQVGGESTGWARWNTYAIDSDSLVLEGKYLKYKSIFITPHGGPPPEDIKVDCSSKRRGPVAGSDTYATYEGTIAGEEVKTACALAIQQGLLKE